MLWNVIFIRHNLQSCNASKHKLVQLMDIVSNFIYVSNHCDANRVFVKFREMLISTAAAPRCRSLNANLRFKGHSHQLFLHR